MRRQQEQLMIDPSSIIELFQPSRDTSYPPPPSPPSDPEDPADPHSPDEAAIFSAFAAVLS